MYSTRNVGIITAPRSNGIDYLSKTLVSLFTNAEYIGEVHIFNGSRETSYLAHFERNPRIRVHQIPNSVRLEESNQWDRCWLNYKNALEFFSDMDTDAYLFEDDVVFTNGFFGKAWIAQNQIEKELESYALSLYTPISAQVSHGQEVAVFQHPQARFFGCQGMYFPAKTIKEFLNGFHETLASRNKEGIDMIIKDYFDSTNSLFFTAPSLCQHIGEISTGTYGPSHRASNFRF